MAFGFKTTRIGRPIFGTIVQVGKGLFGSVGKATPAPKHPAPVKQVTPKY